MITTQNVEINFTKQTVKYVCREIIQFNLIYVFIIILIVTITLFVHYVHLYNQIKIVIIDNLNPG